MSSTSKQACIPSRAIGGSTRSLAGPVFSRRYAGSAGDLLAAFGLGKVAAIGVAAVATLLLYEHSLVSSKDLSKLNAAFFTMNGVISIVFFLFIAGDLLLENTRRLVWVGHCSPSPLTLIGFGFWGWVRVGRDRCYEVDKVKIKMEGIRQVSEPHPEYFVIRVIAFCFISPVFL